jgi:hypothetical protein
MAYTLEFDIRQEYDSRLDGITIETILSVGNRQATAQAKIDSGSALCLFQREIGERLGLVIEAGERTRIGTLAGLLEAFGHTVTLSTLGLEFESVVYFAADYDLPRNLLGRQGWLPKVWLAVIDYDATIYLRKHDR